MGVPSDPNRLFSYMAEHDPPCPECRYNLGGVRTRRCPECGAHLTVEAFLRAKRRTTNMPAWIDPLAKTTAMVTFVTICLWLFGTKLVLFTQTRWLVLTPTALSIALIFALSVCVLIAWKKDRL